MLPEGVFLHLYFGCLLKSRTIILSSRKKNATGEGSSDVMFFWQYDFILSSWVYEQISEGCFRKFEE